MAAYGATARSPVTPRVSHPADVWDALLRGSVVARLTVPSQLDFKLVSSESSVVSCFDRHCFKDE
jgi:hypothetical protein